MTSSNSRSHMVTFSHLVTEEVLLRSSSDFFTTQNRTTLTASLTHVGAVFLTVQFLQMCQLLTCFRRLRKFVQLYSELFRSLSRFHDLRWGSGHKATPGKFSTASAILLTVHQSVSHVLTPPFHHLWVRPQDTWSPLLEACYFYLFLRTK